LRSTSWVPILLPLILFAVSPSAAMDGPQRPGPRRVFVSLPPQEWLVESIGGPMFEARALVGPGDSEETYSPSDAQVSEALRAEVFFRIGASFEEAPWFRALAAVRRIEIVDTRAGVELESGDPHVWTSPRLLAIQARTVAATLARLEPARASEIDRRLAAVERELESLDRELATLLAPHRGRAFFVFHPTWAYLARDYGLRQIAVENEGKEPGDRDLTRVFALARSERPRSFFVDRQVAGRTAESVAAAIGVPVVRLDALAVDVPANLRAVAHRLIESFAP